MPGWLSPRRALLVALCAVLAPLLAAAAEITHFDLRQEGSAALVTVAGQDGAPQFILIDTGRASTGGRGAALVRDELAKRGITRLDLLILTHLDADHAEGTFTLLGVNRSAVQTKDSGGEGIRGPPVAISRILLPADTLPQHKQFRQELISAAKAAGAEVVSPSSDVVAAIEKEYAVTVLVPPSKPKTPNETSLVIVGYDRPHDTAFLFTGDLPVGMIREMLPNLPNHVNVLQAPHHGADRGLLDLVAKTNPDYIVISADDGNRYAHPKLSILRSLACIRPPPTHVEVLFSNTYGGNAEDRFNATKLATEVRTRVERAVRNLKDPNPAGSFADHDLLLQHNFLSLRPDRSELTQPAFTKSIGYDQVLITGERGNLKFIDGKFSGQNDPEAATFMSIVWRELSSASDSELEKLRSWDDAQVYLSILAANRESLFDSTPLSFSGADAAVSMKKSRILEMGRSRVTGARWEQLVQMCLAQSIAEREEALRGVRDSFLHPQFSLVSVSEEELNQLMAAAVADYETGSGDKNVTRVTESINEARSTAWDDRMYQASEEIRNKMKLAEPASEHGWLAPTLEKIGVPKEFAGFSGAFLEEISAVRAIP
jgi:beta-lactamase superfamily II metal-dependent hydrolase